MKAWGLELARIASIATVMLREKSGYAAVATDKESMHLPAIRAVLESDGEGYTRCKFTMELRFSSTCTYGTPRDHLGADERGGRAIIERNAYNLQYTVEI